MQPKAKRLQPIQKKMQPKKEQYEPVVESDKLTDKQRLFCIYYIKYFNATKAYKCDYMTAMASSSGLLRNVKVSEEIDRVRNERLNKKKLSVDDILQKYIDIAFADITDFIEFGTEEREERDEDGDVIYDMAGNPVTYLANYVRFKEHHEIDGTIITEIKQGKDGVLVKLADKMKALDMLAKYTDLIPDHFKRQLETEKLKIAHAKALGTDDQKNMKMMALTKH